MNNNSVDIGQHIAYQTKLLEKLVERLAPKDETSNIMTFDGINSVGGSIQTLSRPKGFNQVTASLVKGTVYVYKGNAKLNADGTLPTPFLIFTAGASVPTPIGSCNETVITAIVLPGQVAQGSLIFYNY